MGQEALVVWKEIISSTSKTQSAVYTGRKAMINLDRILKSRDMTLPTKVHLVKAMVFPVVMYGLEKEMATHSSILAWRIPGTAEPGGLPSVGSHRVRHY